jgi:hypothetical protein
VGVDVVGSGIYVVVWRFPRVSRLCLKGAAQIAASQCLKGAVLVALRSELRGCSWDQLSRRCRQLKDHLSGRQRVSSRYQSGCGRSGRCRSVGVLLDFVVTIVSR